MSEPLAVIHEPLPTNWSQTPVGDVLSLVNGFAFKPSHWNAEGLPIIRIQNLNNKAAPYNYCTEQLPEKFRVKHGDLLFAWSGTPGTSFGAHIWRGGPAWLNQHIFRVDFSEELFDRRFLQLAINANLAQYIAAAHGGAGLAHITAGKFKDSILLLPPFKEQRRIVAEIEKQFTRLDAAVAALKRVQANLKRYRAAVLKAACEGRLVPTEAELARKEGRSFETGEQLLARILKERRAKWEGDQLAKMQASGKPPKNDDWKKKYKEPRESNATNLPHLPEGWIWASADQLCSQVTDGEHIQPPYQPEGCPMLSAMHVRDGWVEFENFGRISETAFSEAVKRCKPEMGDILIVSVGATTGRPAIVQINEPFAIVRSVLLLKCVRSVYAAFLLNWIRSPWCQEWIRTASGASAQPHFYISDTKRMPIPLPPEQEIARIAEELDRTLPSLNSAGHTVTTDLARADRLRQAILKRGFEGKLVPQDSNDEPASALLERIRAARIAQQTSKATTHRRVRMGKAAEVTA